MYVVMIVAGSLLNYYIDSPVFVGVIMLGISLTLNRGTNTRHPAKPRVSQGSRSTDVSRSIETPRVSSRNAPVVRMQNVGVVARSYCPNCGKQSNSIAKYCVYCGAQLKTPQTQTRIQPQGERYTPDEIMNQIVSLRDYYLSGGIDEESYLNIYEKSVFVDGWNRRWAVGANSLKWYRYEAGNWVNDIPTGTLAMS